MFNSKKLIKMIVLAMMIAIGVVISPILRVEGMCPMAHFINVVCAVLLGPWYALACATIIGIIRMVAMGIPPLALTGAIFGALFSGVFYRISKGNLLFAVLGEVVGTGIIGAIISYPIMSLLFNKEGLSWFFYVPSFVCGTFIGGTIAFAFLKKLSNSGKLTAFQEMLQSKSYEYKDSIIGNSVSISAIGVILFFVINILSDMFSLQSQILTYVAYVLLICFIVIGIIYLVAKAMKGAKNDA